MASNSVNIVIILGNLGSDPQLRYIQSGAPVCTLSVATNESWTDRAGKKQEHTEWHRIEVWGKQAEACGTYLRKGRCVHVTGRARTDRYTDKDGVERFARKVVADKVTFVGGAGGNGNGNGNGHGSYAPAETEPEPAEAGYEEAASVGAASVDDDVPF